MAIVTIKIIETIVMDTDTNQIISTERTVTNSEGMAAPTKAVSRKATVKKQIVEDDSDPCVKLEDGKLVLNSKAVSLIEANSGDRVCVSYVQKEDGSFIPIIGTQENMGDNVNGNKLTKALTVSYKGKQATALSQYGKQFSLKILSDKTAEMNDPNHEGMIDIKDSELIPMPKDVPPISIEEDSAFLDNFNQSFTQENFEKSDEDATFDFDFNNI